MLCSGKKIVKWFFFICLVCVFGIVSVGTAAEMAEQQVAVIGSHGSDLGSIDPIASVGGQDRVITPHIFGALVSYPLGDVIAPKFEPDLAEKWEVSADKLTWTFHLRKGVKWHWDYGEVTSEDVVYSLNRVKNSKRSAWRGYYKNFKEVKAVDKYTVKITTGKVDPFLLTKVCNYFGGFIVCKKAAEKAGDIDQGLSPSKEQVIGTGAFKFVEYKTKDRVVLVRNDDYWRGKPIIEKVIIRFVRDPSVRSIALEKGEIACTRGIDDQKWLTHVRSKGILVEPLGPTNLKAIYFNLEIKPFDDIRVRKAFAYATNPGSIMKMQGEEISGDPASPVPSGVAGHVDAGWADYKRDCDKAKKLLSEAGYPDGLKMKLEISNRVYYLHKMIVFQNELKKCGIDIEMNKIDGGVYTKKVMAGQIPLFMWGERFPLATWWLRNRYHSDSIIGRPNQVQNFMRYSNTEVDKLIEVAETTFDEEERNKAVAEAQRLIVKDLVAIPVVETRIPAVRHAWLDLGYTPKNNFLYNYQVGWQSKILKH
jgi:peptide/nickel transport system substrate-binding protein